MRDKTPREALAARKRTQPEPPGPIPTIGQLAAHVDWTWLDCNGCGHRTAIRYAPLIERYGADASSDVIRRNARCKACGHKGARLFHPSWNGGKKGGVKGWAPFPVDEPASAAFDRLYAEFGPEPR